MARLTLALPVFACVLALAACGGSSGLTKEQYDAKVSHLCLLAADQFREMHLMNTTDDWRYYAPRIVHVRVHFAKALAALKPPSAIAPDAAGYLRANRKALADDKRAIAAARAGDTVGFVRALRAEHRDDRTANRTAKAVGATGCYIP